MQYQANLPRKKFVHWYTLFNFDTMSMAHNFMDHTQKGSQTAPKHKVSGSGFFYKVWNPKLHIASLGHCFSQFHIALGA
jgi:hypothetical protein